MRSMFKFKKGDRVEVLSKSQVPSGSWLCGTLISGNGHTYLIQFDNPNGTRGAATEGRVPRKAIRPCPPVKVKERWAAGDLVEVYGQYSWTSATVLEARGGHVFLVRLLGNSHNVETHKSCLRIPQSWRDGEWSVIHKVSKDTETSYSEFQLDMSVANDLKERDVRDSSILPDHEADFQVSHIVSPRSLKRTATCNIPVKRYRAAEKEGRPQCMAPENIVQFPLMYGAAKSPDISEWRKGNSQRVALEDIMQSLFEEEEEESIPFLEEEEETEKEDSRFIKAKVDMMRFIFRFKKGDRVEVLSKSQVPSGSWLCGTLISGNGHTYLIQFDNPNGTRGATTEGRVPRKAIRPCPPAKVKERWAAGDLVEVYDQYSWKSATVLEARGGHVFLVRLLGNSHNVETHKSRLRIPQSWRDGAWSVIHKVSEDTGKSYSKYQLDRSYQESVSNVLKERDVRDSSILADHEAYFQVSHMVFPRTLMRSETCNIPVKKCRAAEKEGRPQPMALENIMQSPLKYRADKSPDISERRKGNCQCVALEDIMQSPSKYRARSPDISERGTENADVMFSGAIHNDGKIAERNPCSVDRGANNKRKLGDGINKMAWDAYRTTMESLGTIGRMSWAQEENMTDLRLMLNISNEEHLLELKKYSTTHSSCLAIKVLI